MHCNRKKYVKGCDGKKGHRGECGQNGDIGPQGTTGQRGYRGYDGSCGDRGATGATGAGGATGATGMTHSFLEFFDKEISLSALGSTYLGHGINIEGTEGANGLMTLVHDTGKIDKLILNKEMETSPDKFQIEILVNGILSTSIIEDATSGIKEIDLDIDVIDGDLITLCVENSSLLSLDISQILISLRLIT